VEREGRPSRTRRPDAAERLDQVREVQTMPDDWWARVQEDARRNADRLARAQDDARRNADLLARAQDDQRKRADALDDQRKQADRLAQAQDEQRRNTDRLARVEEAGRVQADLLAEAAETARIRAEALDIQRAEAARLAGVQETGRVYADRLARAQDTVRAQADKLARAEQEARVGPDQDNVPERGTPEFSLFAQKAYASRFGDTEAIRLLWLEASKGQPDNRSGFNAARDKFWAAVRDENDPRADLVRAILEQAGIDLSGGGAPSLLQSRDPDRDKGFLGEFKKLSSDRAIDETVARMRDLPDKKREYRLSAMHTVDIDHAMPASIAAKDEKNPDPTKWLDPYNLQFMFGDDNRWFKGAKVFPSGE
jgi:hypothetical protein